MAHFIKLTNEDGELYYVNMDRVAYFTGYTDDLTAVEFMITPEDPPMLVKETLGEIHRLLQSPRI